VAILSVTEGEDKPIKYPDMFHAAQVMILNKIDLLPHLDFDVEKCIQFARRVNPQIQVLQLSARSGEGMPAWLEWIAAGVQRAIEQQKSTIDGLRQRNAALEAEVAALKSRVGEHS
jgi:hydrogenase nickel incorporation protein HypB